MIRVLAWVVCLAALQDEGETARYLRPSAKGKPTECTIKIQKSEKGWSIESVTGRGKSTLSVTARYDGAESLLEAAAVLATGEDRKECTVAVREGRATVRRHGKEAQEFDVPKGVIVTSAPDWTDVFLISRLRDRGKTGRQEFAGLWIHPEQPAQRLTFTAERLGTVTLAHGGKDLEVDRLSIRLRGNSEYVAWADALGRMIKLVSVPPKEGGTELVLEGFEEPAARLKVE